MARQVLPVVGAIIGAYFGNPQLGWAIGSAIGNAVDPEVIKGPKLGDIAQQTAMEGGPRPYVIGTGPPIAGNVIASGPPRKVTSSSGGKGGPEVQTESVFRTYAIGVCEGVHELIRAWRNSTLVYDVSDNPLLTTEDNVNFLQKAHWFTGTFEQEPSPDLEAIFGVGTTPAHRGTAYLVVADEDLTDLRGAIPQWTFQTQSCALAAPFIEFTAGVDPLNPIQGFGYTDSAYAFTGGIGAAFGTLIDRATDDGFTIVGARSLNKVPPETQQVFQVYMSGVPGSGAAGAPRDDLFVYCDVYVNDVLTRRFETAAALSSVNGGNPDSTASVRDWLWSPPLGTNLIEEDDVIRIEFFDTESPGPFP